MRSLRQDSPARERRPDFGRRRVITPFAPDLPRRWAEGCRTATAFWREIRAQGFAYSLTNVQRFVAGLRRAGTPPTGKPRTALTKPHGPPPRRVAALVPRRPERRADEERACLAQLSWGCCAGGKGTDCRPGPTGPRRAGSATSRGARRLRGDPVAVRAGLTRRHSNGQTEGQVVRLKLVKRAGCGRAKVDPLRKRVLARSQPRIPDDPRLALLSDHQARGRARKSW